MSDVGIFVGRYMTDLDEECLIDEPDHEAPIEWGLFFGSTKDEVVAKMVADFENEMDASGDDGEELVIVTRTQTANSYAVVDQHEQEYSMRFTVVDAFDCHGGFAKKA